MYLVWHRISEQDGGSVRRFPSEEEAEAFRWYALELFFDVGPILEPHEPGIGLHWITNARGMIL